jgi:hypothetical protein
MVGEYACGLPLTTATIEFLALGERPDKALRLVLGMEFVTFAAENNREP